MIGVAVSTWPRPVEPTLDTAMDEWFRLLPDDAAFAVTEQQGTAASKNAGIGLLMDAGCEHLFLVDDDAWPTIGGWWEPYLEADQPHLSLCWGNSRRLHTSGPYTIWAWPRGVVLYAHARVIETIGGMRTEFDQTSGGEHVEWSRRINAAGLTRWPFADLTAAPTWWHAEDWARPGETHHALGRRRTGNTTIHRGPDIAARQALYNRFRHTLDYVPYR